MGAPSSLCCLQVRALLAAFAGKIRCSQHEFDTSAIRAAVLGLRGMSSDVEEVRGVVGALADAIMRSANELDRDAIEAALCMDINPLIT